MVCFKMGGHRHYVYLCVLLSFTTTIEGWCGSSAEEEVQLDDVIPEKNQFLSKRTGYVGDSIVIGSYHEPYYPNAKFFDGKPTSSASVYKCKLSTEASDYQPAFETEVYKGEERNETSNYFYYIAKEMWTCSDKQENPDKSDFYRIKNVLISMKKIYEIKYIPETRVARINYSQNGERVRVEEIKYYKKNKDNTYEQVSAVIEGITKIAYSLILDKKKKSPIPSLSRVYPLPIWNDLKDPTSLEISTSGDSFKIGSTWNENGKYPFRGNHGDDMRCYWNYEINPELFRPEVFRVHTLQGSLKIYGKISDKEFEESFILIERALYRCSHFLKSGYRINERFIYLVKQEVIGKKPIAELFYGKGIDSVSSISIPGGTSIRYTEVSLFRYDNLQRVDVELGAKFENLISFEKPSLLPTIGEHRKLEYNLGYNEVFRTLISGDGLDLRVGSDKERDIYEGCPTAICRKSNEYLDEYRTEIKILIKNYEFYDTRVITNDHKKKYYEYTSQEVWSCECGDSDEAKLKTQRIVTGKSTRSSKIKPVQPSFIKIINKLKMLVSIREIETFDGVELIHGTSDTSTKHTLGIIETKYYNPNTGQPLNHFGKIEVVYDPPASDLNDAPHWTHYIQKEIDEVVDWIDQRTDKGLKDCEKYDCFTKNTLTVGKGSNALQFSYSKKVENEELENPLYICKPEPEFKDWKKQQEPAAIFKILGKDSKKVETVTDASRSLQYFELLKTEYWFCKLQKTAVDKKKSKMIPSLLSSFCTSQSDCNADELIRVVYRQSLKKPAPNDVGKIEYFEKNDKVWIDSIGDQYVVKTENIRYYKPGRNFLQLSDLNNRLLLQEQIPPPKKWRSGTEQILDADELKTLHEISYFLNATAEYEYGPFNEQGVRIEVGSPPEETVEMIPDKDVKCKMIPNSDIYKVHATRVIINPKSSEAKEFESAYHVVNAWSCMRNMKNIFNLVMIRTSFIGKDISHINCIGDIKVETYDTPKSKPSVETTELKFLKPNSASVIRYDYPVFLEVEQDFIFEPEIIKRLYPMPWTGKPPIYFAMAYVTELKKMYKEGSIQNLKEIQAVTYLKESHVYTSTSSGTFPPVYKIEANFKEEFPVRKHHDKMYCLFDRWTKNKLSHIRYIPEVLQYVGDKTYKFDEDEIFGKFLVQSKLWFCVVDEIEIIKVEIRMTPRTSMYILYSGSVTIEESDNISTIVINAYINRESLTVYKYEKKTYELQEPN